MERKNLLRALVRILPLSSFYSSFPSLRNISIVILFFQVYFVLELCNIKEQMSLFYCGSCFNYIFLLQSKPESWAFSYPRLVCQAHFTREGRYTVLLFVSYCLLSECELYMRSLHLSSFSVYETLLPIFKFKGFD